MRKHVPATTSYEITGATAGKETKAVKATEIKDEKIEKINFFKPNGSNPGGSDGTADTMHKTFDSERGKNGTDMRMCKPPTSGISKVRP